MNAFGCELQENPSSPSSSSSSAAATLPPQSKKVFLWSIEDVHIWLKSIGFNGNLKQFKNINGDLLLRLTSKEMKEDIDEGTLRQQRTFWRELENLKLSADYTPLDSSDLNGFLRSVNPELCLYTYRMLRNGVTRSQLARMSDNGLVKECGIKRSEHRKELMNALKTESASESSENGKEVSSKLPQQFSYELPSQVFSPPPFKLPQQVPSWKRSDVSFWLKRIGFEAYIDSFLSQAIDGDLLLQLKDVELKDDLGMVSGLHRKRFLRELDTLKVCADYSDIDLTNLEKILETVSPELSVYTYQMLANGIDSKVLPSLTYEMMTECGITNPVHRLKLAKAYNIAPKPEVSSPQKSSEIQVYISYRNSPGAELASLIKIYLELHGYRVKMDIDNLEPKDLRSSLLRAVQSAKYFILILTPNSLEPILDRPDQMYMELKSAFTHGKTIVTVNHKDFKQTEEWHSLEVLKDAFSVNWSHDYQSACIQKIIKCFNAK